MSPLATTDRWKWTIKRLTIPPGIVCFTHGKKPKPCPGSMINSLVIDIFRGTSFQGTLTLRADEDFY